MGRTPDPNVLRPVCPDLLHAGSQVVCKDVRTSKSGAVRKRFQCTPVGYPRHKFTVVVAAPSTGLQEVVVAARPPSCPEHPGGRVIRNGMYPSVDKAAVTGQKRRQRYRCFPAPGVAPHDFSPALPRLGVEFGTETCGVCEELTGVHHGAKSSARANSSLLSVVVDALEQVASGQSYTSASGTARRKMGPYTRRDETVNVSAWQLLG